MISRLRASLTDLCEAIIEFFSLPILLMMYCNTGHAIIPAHGIYQFLSRYGEQETAGVCIMYSPMLRLLVYAIITFFICSEPVRTSDEVIQYFNLNWKPISKTFPIMIETTYELKKISGALNKIIILDSRNSIPNENGLK